MFKRIKISKDKSVLTLVSDNVMYEPFTMKSSDVLEVWEFVAVIEEATNKENIGILQQVSILEGELLYLKQRLKKLKVN